MMRRTFLGFLTLFFPFLRKAEAAPPPKRLAEVKAPPPERHEHLLHDWIISDLPDASPVKVQVCSHPDCLGYKVTDEESVEVVNPGGTAANERIRILHTDPFALIEHIIAYVDKTGADILVADEPMERLLGFISEGVSQRPHFVIKLTAFKQAHATHKDWLSYLGDLQKAFATQEGKLALVENLRKEGLLRRARRVQGS